MSVARVQAYLRAVSAAVEREAGTEVGDLLRINVPAGSVVGGPGMLAGLDPSRVGDTVR